MANQSSNTVEIIFVSSLSRCPARSEAKGEKESAVR